MNATDGTNSATQTFSWEVDPRVSLDAIADQTNVPGDSVSLALSGEENASSGTLTYSATGLPAGLTLDGTSGNITGTLTAADQQQSLPGDGHRH